jgi:hypothetical protein
VDDPRFTDHKCDPTEVVVFTVACAIPGGSFPILYPEHVRTVLTMLDFVYEDQVAPQALLL